MSHVTWRALPEEQREYRLEVHEFDTISISIDLGERIFSVSFNPDELTRRDWRRAMRLRRGYAVAPDSTLASERDGIQTWESHF